MVFSFDTIYFCVYNNIMEQKTVQPLKSKLDHRFASYTFLLVIGIVLAGIVFVNEVAASSGADLGNFWEANVAIILRYVFLFGLFWVLSKQLKSKKWSETANVVGSNKKLSIYNIALVFIIAGLALASFMLLVQGFSDIIIWFGYKSGSSLVPNDIMQYIMAVFTLCLLPAIIEELFFRGYILKGLRSMGKTVAVVGSTVLFVLFHLNPEQVVFQFILGVLLATVVLQTGNLLYGIILHFLNNFFVVTMAYIFADDPLVGMAWNPMTVAVAVGLAVVGTIMLIEVVKAIRSHGEQPCAQKTAKFFSFDNVGYFIGVALVLGILVVILI